MAGRKSSPARTSALQYVLEMCSKEKIPYRLLPSGIVDLETQTKKGHWIPVKVMGGDGSFFKIRKSYRNLKDVRIIFVWDVFETPKAIIMNLEQAFKILGPQPLETEAWKKNGNYSWSSATGVPSSRKRMMLSYQDKWHRLTQ